ncbi:hypothetical protein [Streptomyces sp. NBC_00063]|uniref:hypothetical protein n=1 Tax=Streptomyces sp. NBC_00063 TaxID=2975638 RepID=UPI003D7380AA
MTTLRGTAGPGACASTLAASPSRRSGGDVNSYYENGPDDWSFADGRAQYVEGDLAVPDR